MNEAGQEGYYKVPEDASAVPFEFIVALASQFLANGHGPTQRMVYNTNSNVVAAAILALPPCLYTRGECREFENCSQCMQPR